MEIKRENTGRYTSKVTKYYSSGEVCSEKHEPRIGAIARDVAGGVFVAISGFMSAFTIGEGERGVVTRFSEAQYQVEPGLHFKVPFIDGVKEIEIRERKSVEDLAAATGNQLPVTATVSTNWIVNSDAVMEVYRRYGSLEQFEERILDPKLRQAAKAAIAKFNADELIRNRQAATAEILSLMVEAMSPYPVSINSPQIENISLPSTYLDAVLAKEKAREDAAREQYNLEKQALEAQQTVQTATANAEATKAAADAAAYKRRAEADAEADAIRVVKQAEADGIKDVEQALSANSLFIDYTRARRWNGQMPQTILGGGENVLLNVK